LVSGWVSIARIPACSAINSVRRIASALSQALWRLRCVDLAHGEAEIGGNAIVVVGDDERSGRTTGLGLVGVVQQPVVQGARRANRSISSCAWEPETMNRR